MQKNETFGHSGTRCPKVSTVSRGAATVPGMTRFSRVGVLKGGPSAEREVSLRSGAAVARGLREVGYDVVEIDVQEPSLALPEGLDGVFVALHGTFGEDGDVQGLLDEAGVPYTGAGAEASRVSFDKLRTKRVLVEQNISTPAFEVLNVEGQRTLPLPVVLKPPRQGSSFGIHIVRNESDWDEAFADAVGFDGEVLVEAYIKGRELTVGVVGEQVLPVLEIRAPDGNYDYDAKYTAGKTEYLVPAPLPEVINNHCQDLAMRTFAALDCRGLARVDLRLDADNRAWVLELNTIPGFTETSLLPKAASAAGIDFPDLCRSIMETASLG